MTPLFVFHLTFFNMLYFDQSDIDFLDSRPEVLNWLTLYPSIFIVSQYNSYQIAMVFRERYPDKQFIVTQIVHGYNDGWLPQQVWDFINNPMPGEGKGPRYGNTEALNRLIGYKDKKQVSSSLLDFLIKPKDK